MAIAILEIHLYCILITFELNNLDILIYQGAPVCQPQSEIDFDDSRCVLFLLQLRGKMREISRKRVDKDFDNLYCMEILEVVERIAIVHDNRLETVTSDYICAHFPGSNISFSPKYSGVQLGCKAHIAFEGEPMRSMTYFVKTHSKGRLLSDISVPLAFDPKELMIYKVLERLDVGCETHFLHRSLQDVYIATLDANHGRNF